MTLAVLSNGALNPMTVPPLDGRKQSAAVLGTLVHRAVTMPFAKPQHLRDGRFGKRRIKVGDAIEHAADLLVTALTRPDEREFRAIDQVIADSVNDPLVARRLRRELTPYGGGSLASAIIDGGGKWWSGPLSEMEKLTDDDEEAVLGMLPEAAARVGTVVENAAVENGWNLLWSEVPIVTNAAGTYLTIRRPDLLARKPGTRRPRILLIELATGLGERISSVKCDADVLKLGSLAPAVRKFWGLSVRRRFLHAPALGPVRMLTENELYERHLAKGA